MIFKVQGMCAGEGCRKIQALADGMADVFYPRRCPVCHEIVRPSEGLAHRACLSKLHYVQGPVCLKCGKPIISGDMEYCSDCRRHRHEYDSGRAVWMYDSLMKKSIAMYKYHGARAYADFYAGQTTAVLGKWIRMSAPDVLIPVPVHWRRKNQRGFNQAALLAGRIGRELSYSVDEHYLVRSAWTEPQKSLTPKQRYANLKRAFLVKGQREKYRTVMLIDDIYTTGSTIDACAAVLKNAGVRKVYFISLCIGGDDGG